MPAPARYVRRSIGDRFDGRLPNVMHLVAPSGYGKTAFATQLAERVPHVAWLDAATEQRTHLDGAGLIVIEHAEYLAAADLRHVIDRGIPVITCARRFPADVRSPCVVLDTTDLAFTRAEVAAMLGEAPEGGPAARVALISGGWALMVERTRDALDATASDESIAHRVADASAAFLDEQVLAPYSRCELDVLRALADQTPFTGGTAWRTFPLARAGDTWRVHPILAAHLRRDGAFRDGRQPIEVRFTDGSLTVAGRHVRVEPSEFAVLATLAHAGARGARPLDLARAVAPATPASSAPALARVFVDRVRRRVGDRTAIVEYGGRYLAARHVTTDLRRWTSALECGALDAISREARIVALRRGLAAATLRLPIAPLVLTAATRLLAELEATAEAGQASAEKARA